MKVLELLDEILAEIEESRKSIFSNKKMIEVDFVLEILQEIREALPGDLEKAQKVLDNRDKIIEEAESKAHNVLKGVDSKISGMIDEHRVTQLAYEKANRLVDAAEKQAYELRIGANDYAVNVLDDLASYMQEYMDIISENKSNFINKKNKDQAEF